MLYKKMDKLLLYSPTNNYSDEILKFAANEIYKYEEKLSGIISEKSVANNFTKYYCDLSKMKYSVNKELKILVLESIENAKLLNNVIYRKATLEDKDIIIKNIQSFSKEAVNEEYDYKKAKQKFNNNFKNGYYILEKDNKIVCQANISRVMKFSKCISGVYTLKDERGKGYAYNLVYRISKELLAKGDKYCVLYTDSDNKVSNHLYEKIGYKTRSEWGNIDFIL